MGAWQACAVALSYKSLRRLLVLLLSRCGITVDQRQSPYHARLLRLVLLYRNNIMVLKGPLEAP